ncbi:MAG: YajQ family cyclic di-GMP-binding protein [Halobacteriovoraceae bacterium]|nr:YajQ family cyclic di-GMP-binding protein [Halobacteriovoraceae bacterium]
MPSFDIVSKLDMGELKNAVDQARREISGRYDFKGGNTSISMNESTIEILAPDEYKIKAALGILRTRMAKRNIGPRFVEPGNIDTTGNQMFKQILTIRDGLDKEQGKTVNKIVKSSGRKLSSTYMDQRVRISGKKIDDLQEIFSIIKNHKDIKVELQMENMKR